MKMQKKKKKKKIWFNWTVLSVKVLSYDIIHSSYSEGVEGKV